MRRKSKQLSEVMNNNHHGVAVREYADKHLDDSTLGELITLLDHAYTYRRCFNLKPTRYWLPAVTEIIVYDRDKEHELACLQQIISCVINVLKQELKVVPSSRGVDGLRDKLTSVIETLKKVASEIDHPPEDDFRSIIAILIASNNVATPQIENTARYFEGVLNDRIAERQRRKRAKVVHQRILDKRRTTVEPDIKIPVRYLIVTKDGQEITWTGFGRVPADFEAALQDTGLSLEQCQVDEN